MAHNPSLRRRRGMSKKSLSQKVAVRKLPPPADVSFECSLPFTVIRLRRLELIDRTGETRCVLQVDEQGVPRIGIPYRKGERATAFVSLSALTTFVDYFAKSRTRGAEIKKASARDGKAGRKAA
jgi:hypothetical protein